MSALAPPLGAHVPDARRQLPSRSERHGPTRQSLRPSSVGGAASVQALDGSSSDEEDKERVLSLLSWSKHAGGARPFVWQPAQAGWAVRPHASAWRLGHAGTAAPAFHFISTHLVHSLRTREPGRLLWVLQTLLHSTLFPNPTPDIEAPTCTTLF